MKHHDNDDCPHLVPMRLLESENARLKADFDVMHSSKLVYFIHGEGRWANVVDENARLKAEVERLKEGNDCLGQMHDKEMERSAYLLEEFNRTTAWGRGLESDLSHARVEISFLKAEVEELRLENGAFKRTVNEASAHYDNRLADIARLSSEVNRLRASSFVTAVPVEQYELVIKAGDALAGNLPYIADSHLSDEVWVDMQAAWNDAKEGKPSA